MARPNKIGIDYFSMDSDFFEDPKIKLLLFRFGSDGISVYFKVITNGYKTYGYYLPADEDTILMIAGELNLTFDRVKEIVEFQLSKALFSNEVYSEFRVLTCRRMQLNYLTGTEKRAKITFQSEYLVIDPTTEKSKNHKAIIDVISFRGNKPTFPVPETPVSGGICTQSESEKESEIDKESESEKETRKLPTFIFYETLVRNLFTKHTKIHDPNLETHVKPILKFFSQIPENMTEKHIEECITDAFSALNPSINVRIDYLSSNIQGKITAKNEEIIKNLKKKEADEAALLRKRAKELNQQHNKEDTLKTLSTYKTFFTENANLFSNREKSQLLEHFKKGEILKAGMIIEPKMKGLEESRLLKTTLEEKLL